MQLAELAKVRAGQQRECRSQAGRGGEAATHSLPAGTVCRAQAVGSFFLVLLWLAPWGHVPPSLTPFLCSYLPRAPRLSNELPSTNAK